MSMSKHLRILIVSALLALLVFAPGDARNTHAGTAEPPPNDDFADAMVISELPFSDIVDTTQATNESHEPAVRCGPSGNTTPPPSASVWYRFDAISDAVLSADTLGSDFDTIIGLFVETDFGLEYVTCTSSAGPAAVPGSLTSFRAIGGKTYVFQVGGRAWSDMQSGLLAFNLKSVPPPGNDNFADAETIGLLPALKSADLVSATVELDEPISTCVFGAGGIDIRASAWYRLDSGTGGFIRADTRFVTTVFRGDSLRTLEEIACGTPVQGETRVGFQVTSGETVYVQVATLLFLPPVAGHFESTRVGDLGFSLSIDEIDLPECPAPSVRFEDAEEDVSDFFAPPVVGGDHDIRSVQIGSTESYTCVEIEFARPIPPPDPRTATPLLRIDLDTDSDGSTRFPSDLCAGGNTLGVETSLALDGRSGALVDSLSLLPLDRAPNEESTLALFDGTVMTIMIPSSLAGGDQNFRFVMQVNGPGGRDCAPNRGFIQVPAPALGDANCDGAVDSRDAVVILQFFAQLVPSLPCESVADANGNGTIGSIDAALILQLDAGLIDFLPAAASEAIAAVIRATAETLSVPEDQVIVTSVSAETWPNGCLGLSEPGEAISHAPEQAGGQDPPANAHRLPL